MSSQSSTFSDETRIRVVAICGSLRPESLTRRALIRALAGAATLGAETTLLDLRDYELIFCSGDKDADQEVPGVQRLKHDLQQAQGILLGTPEYHGGMSGVLKNALDLMGFDEFRGKMIGLIGVSGGAMGGLNALNSLRTIGRSLHAWVVPEQVTIPQAWRHFTDDGTIKNADLARRLDSVGQQVARFAYLHNSATTMEFLRAWESAPINPGGDIAAD